MPAARPARRRGCVIALAAAALALVCAPGASARQFRVSPGPLSRPHAALEGVTNCGRCHDAVQGVSADRCLACHKPIAARIAARTGVHRSVSNECGRCHVEHKGADADLRRIDRTAFNHATETGFPLEGAHAKVAAKCGACHKRRSFMAARAACNSCHADTHKGSLGTSCTTCHSTTEAFKETGRQFDHKRAKFALTGAHRTVACEKCHLAGVFRGLKFDTCSACHKEPHRRPLGPACTSCHVTDRWTTRTLDHARTGFTLVGAHQQVACAKCHTTGIKTPLQSDRCSACHANVHRESLREDCRKCHKETSFRGATFDHAAQTRFPLVGKHEGLACRKCHTGLSGDDVPLLRKVIDFTGTSAACVSCHKDHHKGEYGRLCDACHGPSTFKASGFVHPRSPEFFAGRHQGVACARCHVRAGDAQQAVRAPSTGAVRAETPSMACITCHADVHGGQVGKDCERCHAVDAARFAPVRFSHDVGAFPLSGKHKTAACVKCHPVEPRAFPGGSGTGKRLKLASSQCQSCHKDPHLGQVADPCSVCHSTTTFAVTSFEHRGQEYTFSVASHDRLPCKSCHKTETRQFPAGWGTALRLKVGTKCIDCHP